MATIEREVDGRSARRVRNIDVVLAAVYELLVEGQIDFSPELAAARSGLSSRSLYRYFPTREQLIVASLGRQLDLAGSVFLLDRVGAGSRAQRAGRFVRHRSEIYEQTGPTLRVALVMARDLPVVAEVVRGRRAQMRAVVADQFGPDLHHLEPRRREDYEEALDVLCQPESFDALRSVRGLTVERTHEVMTAAVLSLLAAAAVAPVSLSNAAEAERRG